MTKLMKDTTQLDETTRPLSKFPLAFASRPETTGDKQLFLESELQDIEKWLPEVRSTNAHLLEQLQCLNDTISGNGRSVALSFPLGAAPIDVLYRLNHTAKASRYHKDLGVLCSGWSPPHAEPLPANAESLRKHFTWEDRSASPFISVSESPNQIINVSKFSDCGRHKLEVLVMNPETLHNFRVRCQRSTKWAQDLRISSPMSGVTGSHGLIERWIPRECIKVVTFKDFERLCKVKYIIPSEFQLEISRTIKVEAIKYGP